MLSQISKVSIIISFLPLLAEIVLIIFGFLKEMINKVENLLPKKNSF